MTAAVERDDDREVGREVHRYLRALRRELRDLPPPHRREILTDFREDLLEAVVDVSTREDAAAVIARFGTPREVSEAARAAAGLEPIRQKRIGAFQVVTVLFLLLGGILPPLVGWVVGIAMLWSSSAWRTRDKIIGTLIVPGGLAFLLVALFMPFFISAGGSTACSERLRADGTYGPEHCIAATSPNGGVYLALALMAAGVVAQLFTTVWLLMTARPPVRYALSGPSPDAYDVFPTGRAAEQAGGSARGVARAGRPTSAPCSAARQRRTYLAELRRELKDLPWRRRREVMSVIRQHIADLYSDAAPVSPEDARLILDHTGDPSDIASSARRELGRSVRRGPTLRDVAIVLAVLVCPIAASYFPHGTAACSVVSLGVIALLWWSPAWTVLEKTVGTLFLPIFVDAFSLVILIPKLITGTSLTSQACSGSRGSGWCGPSAGLPGVANGVFAVVAAIGMLIVPLAIAFWMLRRARPRPAPEPPARPVVAGLA